MDGIKFGNLLKIFLEYDEKHSIDHNARRLRVSYSWLFNTLKDMEKKDLVMINKIGRDNKVKFTPRGDIVKEHFKGIYSILIE